MCGVGCLLLVELRDKNDGQRKKKETLYLSTKTNNFRSYLDFIHTSILRSKDSFHAVIPQLVGLDIRVTLAS